MKLKNYLNTTFLLILSVFVVSCGDDDDNSITNPYAGAVYAMDNSATDNTVYAYGRNTNGTLTYISSTSTSGTGVGPVSFSAPGANTIDPLASNYAVQLSEDNSLLFAVNAGSDEISSFVVNPDDYSLTFAGKISSGGTNPISLEIVGSNLFVLNENGGTGQINSFTFDAAGILSSGSSITLEGRPLTIKASKDNSHLIATILPQTIQVFGINGASLTSQTSLTVPMVTGGSAPAVPFGIETVSVGGTQYIITSDARGGASETSTVSSYSINSSGMLTNINTVLLGSDPATGGQVAACWLVADSSGTEIYTSNTVSSTLSNINLATDGTLTVDEVIAYDAELAPTDSGLTDLVAVGDYIYQLYSASGKIEVLSRNDDGTLTSVELKSGNLSSQGGNQGITGF